MHSGARGRPEKHRRGWPEQQRSGLGRRAGCRVTGWVLALASVLAFTRGLPGAGKTTWAMGWVQRDPERRVRVGTDEIAAMLHPQLLGDHDRYGPLFAARELLVVNTIVETLLCAELDVVCDGPFLLPEYVDAVRGLAERCRAELVVCDLTDVDVEVCIARDAQRRREGGRSIGAQQIRNQHREFCEQQGSARGRVAAAAVRGADGR